MHVLRLGLGTGSGENGVTALAYCIRCGENPVDVNDGYGTCPECLAQFLDLNASGFSLLGGRVDALQNRRVAAIV